MKGLIFGISRYVAKCVFMSVMFIICQKCIMSERNVCEVCLRDE